MVLAKRCSVCLGVLRCGRQWPCRLRRRELFERFRSSPLRPRSVGGAGAYQEIRGAFSPVAHKKEIQIGEIMQTGKVLSTADVKKILAEYFHVSEDKVLPLKYSFVILEGKEEK